jgi:hypothetical protein
MRNLHFRFEKGWHLMRAAAAAAGRVARSLRREWKEEGNGT